MHEEGEKEPSCQAPRLRRTQIVRGERDGTVATALQEAPGAVDLVVLIHKPEITLEFSVGE